MTALVTDPIRWWGKNTPDQPAIVFDGRDTVSYREIDRWTDNVAAHLVAAGVRPGDRVGIVGPNTLEWCAGALGALKAGAIVASYSQRLVAPELVHLVESSEPSHVLVDEEHRERMDEVAGAGHAFQAISLDVVRDLRRAPHQAFPRVEVDPDQPAVIVYTSGTTAKPKGVVYSHRTTFSFIFEWGLMEPSYRQGARMIFVLSLAGAPGLLWGVLHMLTRGATLYLEKGFDPKAALDRLVTEKIEIMMGVPVLFEQIAALPDFADADLSSLTTTTVGGARVPLPTLEAWLAKGIAVRQIYGMTELGGTSIANPRDQALSRPESVGNGSMFTQHRVVRADGSDCDPGEPGEIVVQGPSVTPGYWRNEEATAEAKRDGWFHTGDIGVFDEDGYLRMVDRKKDMIISGGYNIAPSEIETVIYELDGVDEVAVISVDDERFGETAAAIVTTRRQMAPAEVVDHCSGRIASYKVPRYVVLLDEPLPRMPSGKIAKRELKARFSELPGATQKVR